MKQNEESLYFELNEKQIKELIKLVQFKKGDIFYDLGCGTGNVVIGVAKTPVEKSIGIESCKKLYNKAKNRLYQGIRKRKIKTFEKIDFWLGDIGSEDLEFNDAKVIFYSLDEKEDTKNDLQNWEIWNKVKIIKKDIPLIGYESKPNRSDDDCWLFLTKPPYKKITSKKEWVKSVSDDFDTLEKLYKYYYDQLSKRFEKLYIRDKKSKTYSKKIGRKEAESSLLQLKMSINNRYFYN